MIVDGIGSLGWVGGFGARIIAAGGAVKVYHKLPWDGVLSGVVAKINKHIFLLSESSSTSLATKVLAEISAGVYEITSRVWNSLLHINHRAHGKLIIVDDQVAFVGSRNITAVHSERYNGATAWRDVSVELRGSPLADLVVAFENTWMSNIEKLSSRLSGAPRRKASSAESVRLNISLRERSRNYSALCKSIRAAKSRVWLTSGYFLPKRSLIRSLRIAKRRGVDVRVLLPSHSDVIIIPWVAVAFYRVLLSAGIPVYEYRPAVLHAKTVLIDDYAIVGSSNLNQRSLRHDLEIDVILRHPESLATLTERFHADLAQSNAITELREFRYPWYYRLLSEFVLIFKYFI